MNKSKRMVLSLRRKRLRALSKAVDLQMRRRETLLPAELRTATAPPDRISAEHWLILAG